MTKRYCIFTVFQALTLLFVGNNSYAQQAKIKSDFEQARKAIESSNRIYFQAFTKGDSSLVINRYTEDCWIMASNTPTLCGIDAPLDFFKIAYHKLGIRNGIFKTMKLYGDAKEFVTEEGLFEFFDASNASLINGKYLVLWKRTPKGWKMFRDSFNPDRLK
jgi:ketosteroid isomerase-like protein